MVTDAEGGKLPGMLCPGLQCFGVAMPESGLPVCSVSLPCWDGLVLAFQDCEEVPVLAAEYDLGRRELGHRVWCVPEGEDGTLEGVRVEVSRAANVVCDQPLLGLDRDFRPTVAVRESHRTESVVDPPLNCCVGPEVNPI